MIWIYHLLSLDCICLQVATSIFYSRWQIKIVYLLKGVVTGGWVATSCICKRCYRYFSGETNFNVNRSTTAFLVLKLVFHTISIIWKYYNQVLRVVSPVFTCHISRRYACNMSWKVLSNIKRCNRTRHHCFVRQKRYPLHEATWEPKYHLKNAPKIVEKHLATLLCGLKRGIRFNNVLNKSFDPGAQFVRMHIRGVRSCAINWGESSSWHHFGHLSYRSH